MFTRAVPTFDEFFGDAWRDGAITCLSAIATDLGIVGGARLMRSERGRNDCGPDEQTNNELAYFVRPELWGRGFGSQIARQALQVMKGWEGSFPLSLHLYRENVASSNIADRLGFRFAGLQRRRGGSPVVLEFVLT